MKYTLKKPIQISDKAERITELNFREEICAGDVRDIKASEFGDPQMGTIVKLASRLSGRTEVELSKLEFNDLVKVGEIVLGFLPQADGPETGTKPSP